MWPRQDNGSAVDWNEATGYCQSLSLGGYSGWRLPTIDELAGIFDRTQNVNGMHIKGGINIISKDWVWSNRADISLLLRQWEASLPPSSAASTTGRFVCAVPENDARRFGHSLL